MDMLTTHAAALRAPTTHYHDFLLRYHATAKVVYGFVEGRQDPCYYRGFIEYSIPDDWTIELWPVGRKATVYQIHASMDWTRYPKKRVCFFVDRDFDDLLREERTKDLNIYVTDDYSIENSIVNRQTCLRTLTEIYGFAGAPHSELEAVCDFFDAEYERFLQFMIGVTALLLVWTKTGQAAHFSNIKMNDLFKISSGTLHPTAHLHNRSALINYLRARCHLRTDDNTSTADTERQLRRGAVYRRFVRGKFALWFFVEFCKSIHANAPVFFSIERSPPTSATGTISISNAIGIIGVRGRMPPTLRAFLRTTYGNYIGPRTGDD